MSAKNVSVTVAAVVVAEAGFIKWIQGSGTTYTVAVDHQTDYITVTDDAGGSSAGHTIQDEGTPLTARSGLNFVGAGVAATDDAGNDQTDVTITEPTADAHVADTSAAHAASAVSVDSTTLVGVGTDVQAVFEEIDDAVATDIAALATHAGAADPHAGYVLESLIDAAGDYIRGSADNTPARQAASAATPAAVSTSGSTGTGGNPPSADDHVHPHEAAHINHDTTWAAQGDLIVATANDTAAVLTKGTSGQFLQAGASTLAYGDVYIVPTWSKEGNLSTGTGTVRWYNDTGRTLTIDSTRASVGTAPLNQSILIDVNVDGTTIFTTGPGTNRPAIAASGNTDQGGAPDTTTIATGHYLTVDIDQVGTSTVGADLSVQVFLKG